LAAAGESIESEAGDGDDRQTFGFGIAGVVVVRGVWARGSRGDAASG